MTKAVKYVNYSSAGIPSFVIDVQDLTEKERRLLKKDLENWLTKKERGQ
jgi:hypothetical protein